MSSIFATVIKKNRIETRGAKAKYNFNLEVGESIGYPAVDAARVRSAMNAFLFRKQLKWKFETWTENKILYLSRVK